MLQTPQRGSHIVIIAMGQILKRDSKEKYEYFKTKPATTCPSARGFTLSIEFELRAISNIQSAVERPLNSRQNVEAGFLTNSPTLQFCNFPTCYLPFQVII